jgi:uncharacterized protein YjhX (UPF0386 family)
MAKARRTTHRSSKGKKLYAVRDAKGRFKDIQTYERAGPRGCIPRAALTEMSSH